VDEAGLLRQVRWLTNQTLDLCMGTPEYPVAQRILRSLDEPLQVFVLGRAKVGKSTVLNALAGEEIAQTAPGLCTRVITRYVWGPVPSVSVRLRSDGELLQVPIELGPGPAHIGSDRQDPSEVDEVIVQWPAQRLRTINFIDSPGIELWSEGRTEGMSPSAERALSTADAVLHLLGHLHASAPDLLEDLNRSAAAPAGGIGRILVLARADELGGSGVDAMNTAGRIAKRYASDARIHRVCQSVLPLAGLAAQGALCVDDGEIQALTRLAELSDSELEQLLVSADRVVKSTTTVPVPSTDRARLLERLGLYGIRLAVELLRRGTPAETASLAPRILERCGQASLLTAVDRIFVNRRDALKSQRALRELNTTLARAKVAGSRGLLAEIERVEAGAHTFSELRLLDSLRCGAVGLPAEEVAMAERLLRESGSSLASRLGIPTESDGTLVKQALTDQLTRWHRRAEAPNAPEEVRDAANVLIRTCEGHLYDLSRTDGLRQVASQ
jgi:GTPase SAR1 family protein